MYYLINLSVFLSVYQFTHLPAERKRALIGYVKDW